MSDEADDAGVECVGCGGRFPDIEHPTHAYLDSAPGCWQCYGEVLAVEYSDPAFFAVHRLTVDAYALQHPGEPLPQTIRSAALHGVALCAVFERGASLADASRIIFRAANDKREFVWLTPPELRGGVTVADVRGAPDADTHASRVREWAECVWESWSEHQPTFAEWLDEVWED